MPHNETSPAGDPKMPGSAAYGRASHGPASNGQTPHGPASNGQTPHGPVPYGPGQVEKTHRFLRFVYLAQGPLVILLPLIAVFLPGGIGSRGITFGFGVWFLAPVMAFVQALIWLATYLRADAAGVKIVSKAVASLLCIYYASALLYGLAASDTGVTADGGIGGTESSILERLGVPDDASFGLAVFSFLAGAAFLFMTAGAALVSNPLPKELQFQRNRM